MFKSSRGVALPSQKKKNWAGVSMTCDVLLSRSRYLKGSADSNYSQPSSDLSLDEEKETLRREKERQALSQLEKARVSYNLH
uniref:Voltage-dependent L-type calcium channel subunit beta-1-4 N-terminal A domain-containing protein n=1 Tax=Timema bartmani TaxID=61472 RepID=A0A7R9EWJ3_9NEOP|nr:unnamed protein product [Timema bartmani]